MPSMGVWRASHERDALRGIQRACTAALDSTSLRREVAARSVRAVPADVFFFNALDPETGLLTHLMGSGAPLTLTQTFLEHIYPSGEAERVLDMAHSGRVVSTESSPDLASAIRAAGLRHELRATFAIGDEPWGLWCSLRAGSARKFEEHEVAFFRRIAPWVARGLRTAALLAAASHAGNAETAADGAGALPGVVVIDQRGHVTHRTDAARAQLDDLADDATALTGLPSAVLGLIARQRLPGGEGERRTREIRVCGRSGRWYSIYAALTEPDECGRSSSVVIVTPLARGDVAPLLARLYGLSPREREVLALAARGNSTKTIAARLGISVYTVQDHLDHASEKVGVRGRRALLAKLFFDGYAPRLNGQPEQLPTTPTLPPRPARPR